MLAEVGSSLPPTPGHSARWPARLLVGLVLLIALAHVGYYFPRVVDDLFISLRYAENLARGAGIVFNPGERVEGYSSPLWMFAQAVGYLFGFEGVSWTKLLGLGSFVAVLIGVYRTARELLAVRPEVALLASLFTALNSYLVDWTLLGLETPAYLALLVWYPIVLRRHLLAGTRKSAWIAGGTTVALAMARPEAPLYIAALALAELVSGERSDLPALRARALTGLRLALPVLLVLVLLFVARRAYFGLWLPHTYYVKGAGSGFDVVKLAPLVDQGVGFLERILYLGAIAIALVMAVKRAPTVLFAMLCSIYFTASVERDWMPSLRHLLPVTVFAPLAWCWAIDRLWQLSRTLIVGRVIGLLCVGVLLGAGAEVAQVDVRFSPDDKHNRPWALPKSRDKLADVWDVMRRIEPAHVTAMGSYDMGMITQNYRVFEAAAQKVEDSWFVGRDIGKVGFYTEVRVFDTAGLFTPAVVQSEPWLRERAVDEALIRRAFADKPVAAELYDAFGPAAGAHQDLLRPYDVLTGSRFYPVDIVQNDRPRPSPHEVLRRYQASLAKFPAWFYLSTLYGESVGAAMRKRTRIVREYVQGLPRGEASAPRLSREQGAGARLANAADTLGCRIWPSRLKAGEHVTVTCWYRPVAQLRERYEVFMHFHDAAGGLRFGADHTPAASLHPTTAWQPGELIVDTVRAQVPADSAPGTYKLYFGLWNGVGRAPVTPAELNDGKDRVPAGELHVIGATAPN